MSGKSKKSLKDSHVAISRVYQKTTAFNTIFTWRVPKYEELECDVMHFQKYETTDMKLVLRIFKHKNTLNLSVTGEKLKKNMSGEFLVLDEVRYSQVKTKAEKICDGVYVGKFPHDSFLSPDSNFLHNGVLTVALKFVSEYDVSYAERGVDEIEILCDLDELCYDLKSLYLDSIYPDFLVHAKDFTFKTHKFILAARSNYFDRLLEDDENRDDTGHRLPDDVLPGILHQVLLYLYCGEMKDMNLDAMLEVYKLAVDLEISSLCDRCQEYFRTRIVKDNYMKICTYAVKFELKELKNIIIRTASEEFPDVNILRVFKQLAESKEKGACAK